MSYPTDEDAPHNVLAPLRGIDARALGLSLDIKPETIREIEAIRNNSRRAMAMAPFIFMD